MIRLQGTVVSNGGRLLTSTVVTPISCDTPTNRKLLRNALDNIQDDVVRSDADLNAHFPNRKMREYWAVRKNRPRIKARFNVTISMGVAAAADSMSGLDTLPGAADQALYRATTEGRSRAVQWLPLLAAE